MIDMQSQHDDAGNIIFIDSENTFRANRVHQIAEQRGLNPLSILEKIYHCTVYSSEHLESVINNLVFKKCNQSINLTTNHTIHVLLKQPTFHQYKLLQVLPKMDFEHLLQHKVL